MWFDIACTQSTSSSIVDLLFHEIWPDGKVKEGGDWVEIGGGGSNILNKLITQNTKIKNHRTISHKSLCYSNNSDTVQMHVKFVD